MHTVCKTKPHKMKINSHEFLFSKCHLFQGTKIYPQTYRVQLNRTWNDTSVKNIYIYTGQIPVLK